MLVLIDRNSLQQWYSGIQVRNMNNSLSDVMGLKSDKGIKANYLLLVECGLKLDSHFPKDACLFTSMKAL